MMPECPTHKETDGSQMKAIWRNKYGYYFCSTCLHELYKQNKSDIKQLEEENDKWETAAWEQYEHACELEKKKNFELEEHQCYNCGKPLKDIIQDPPEGVLFTVCFDHGYPDNRVEPGEPATEYYECYECIREREKKKSPNSSEADMG